MSNFRKAVRTQRKLRAAFDGPSGGGKSYSALRLAFSLVKAGLAKRVAAIDTENNSIDLYAGESPDGVPFDFDVLNLSTYGPEMFTHAMKSAFKEGYDCVVVDSLSHAWVGKGGALDQKDAKGGNSFTAWKDITPIQRTMVDTIITAPAHMICTMRSKTEYVLEDDDKGKKVPRKIGMAPVQRDGLEYEFDMYGSIDHSHTLRISKTRCAAFDNLVSHKPGFAFWEPLFQWMSSAAPIDPATIPTEPLAVPATPFDELAGSVRGCESAADFAARGYGAVIKAAREAGEITDAERAELVTLYKQLR